MALALAVGGIILTLALDQASMAAIQAVSNVSPEQNTFKSNPTSNHNHNHNMDNSTRNGVTGSSSTQDFVPIHNHHHQYPQHDSNGVDHHISNKSNNNNKYVELQHANSNTHTHEHNENEVFGHPISSTEGTSIVEGTNNEREEESKIDPNSSLSKLIQHSGTHDHTQNSDLKLELEVVGHHESEHHHDHAHAHTMLMITDTDSYKAIVKSIVLEVSIAIHSIIIGISFGGLTVNHLIQIKVLFAALTFHQFFEGISLGTAISESNLKFRTVCIFGFFFALTWCVGAIIGINIASDNQNQDDGYISQGDIIQSCFNGVAAGSLIYSALVEMIAEDFSSSELINKPYVKLCMLLFLTLGCVAMAVLAIFA